MGSYPPLDYAVRCCRRSCLENIKSDKRERGRCPEPSNDFMGCDVRPILIGMSFVLFLTNCATSKVTAFRDPAYATKRFKAIVVFAEGIVLDAAVEVEQQVCKKVAPTPCVSGKTVLPPTRQYSANEAQKYLSRTGADGVLVIALTSDKSAKQYF